MDVKCEHVSYTYHLKTPMEQRVLHDINFSLSQRSFTCIIGHTGSGKSTLMEHLNGLLLPTVGKVTVPGGTILAGVKTSVKTIKKIRQQVGLVFQFPEHQLFETTVLGDIMFGPKNAGKSQAEAEAAARMAAKIVGIDEALFEKSPFDLSGGQMRRVAIAGVLAMDPEVLILDEPTVGLDPKGRKALLKVLVALQKEGKALLVVTHDMDLVATHAHHVLVMCQGKKLLEGTPAYVFSQHELIAQAGLYLPTAAAVYTQAFGRDGALPLTVADFIKEVKAKRPLIKEEGKFQKGKVQEACLK
ncbi:MAG: energy-coupling factor transporter ATPase [Defluviitaleaceae bacterium]|nr:energy-coupling factor transporter ATPase [Defluviitaleaceae bacterium]